MLTKFWSENFLLKVLAVDEQLILRWNLRKVDEDWIQGNRIRLQRWALEKEGICLRVQ
jgi:hypothetical protein